MHDGIFPGDTEAGAMLERLLREWGRDPRHAEGKRSITIEIRNGVSLSGQVVDLGTDTFAFRSDGKTQRVPFREVAMVSYNHLR